MLQPSLSFTAAICHPLPDLHACCALPAPNTLCPASGMRAPRPFPADARHRLYGTLPHAVEHRTWAPSSCSQYTPWSIA